jgi:hypothetical protein
MLRADWVLFLVTTSALTASWEQGRPETPPATPVAQALNAKVLETLMGPTVSGGLSSRIVLSEDGEHKHFAAVVSTGTDWVILVDGKVSPGYADMLEPNSGSHRFVDGQTYRFYGIKAGQIYRVRLELGP